MGYKVNIDRDLEMVIPTFLVNRKKDVEALKKALSRSDYDKIQFIGHSLKGVGGGYGFDFITEVGEKLEIGARSRAKDDLSKLILTLDQYLNNLEISYVEI